ncbi:MAG: BamA/TamA family outer membrane protein [Ferruginibacter sp.]|nr:BamA/TamA family outer membrane protein [Ferruginibacter sp.]
MKLFQIKNIIFLLFFFTSCNIYTKIPKDKPYLVENKIVRQNWKFEKVESAAIETRLYNQLDDSSKVTTIDKFLFLKVTKKPKVFDTLYANNSALNMQASLFHLGYYNANVKYVVDTVSKNKLGFALKLKRIKVRYFVLPGKPTLIDTVSYRLKIPELQAIALNSKPVALLSKYNQINKTQNTASKNAVISEINRLVDSFRNNGYYKFTTAELRVKGDSSIEALTNTSDDPFEQLNSLNEAQKKRDSPTVKLVIVLNTPVDTFKLHKYYINKISVISDYNSENINTDTTNILKSETKNFTHYFHEYIFSNALLERNITLHSGDVFRQNEYYKTINNLTKLGVWQSVNVRIVDPFGLQDKVDIFIELLPSKKLSNVNSLEGSYAASSRTASALVGNLLGLALNLSLEDRNVHKEAIKMTHNLRGSVEFNTQRNSGSNNLINSTEISYGNNIIIPRLIFPFQNSVEKRKITSGESFINSNVSYSKRLGLFDLYSANFNFGYSLLNKKLNKFIFKPFFLDYSLLTDTTSKFHDAIVSTPALSYSYNTSYVTGISLGYSSIFKNNKHKNSLAKERSFKVNFEESGLTWGAIPIIKKEKKKYIKFDTEYKYKITYKKSELAFRNFIGVGIPLSNKALTLPFFKQYYGGGSNSMRAWPIRGIGRGSEPLSTSSFKDRTGDIQLEINGEFRHNIIPLFSWLKLNGAIFLDAGNIWNMKNNNPTGGIDAAKFQFKNLYNELGLNAGYGLRFDATYALLRLDFGFRFKRPETSNVNNGWKSPDISFKDGFKKVFSGKTDYKTWRSENFNFTIGINYPF